MKETRFSVEISWAESRPFFWAFLDFGLESVLEAEKKGALMDSLRADGSPRKFLEVPRSPWIKGASILWPRLHLHLYIMMGNRIFVGNMP